MIKSFRYLGLSAVLSLALVAGTVMTAVIAYVVTTSFVGLGFTEFIASSFEPLVAMLFMVLCVGTSLFFRPKIETFLKSVMQTPLERYANRAF